MLLIQMFLFNINKDLKTEKVCIKNQVFKTSMKKKHLWYNKIQERDEILGNILKFKNMSSTKHMIISIGTHSIIYTASIRYMLI